MWVATQDGFFSAVRHRTNPEVLVVRGRSKADIEGLVHTLAGDEDFIAVTHDQIELATLVESPEFSDYPWRTYLLDDDWVTYLGTVTADIKYDNFKNAVHDNNEARATTYMKVWSDMLNIEDEEDSGVTRSSWTDQWHGADEVDWVLDPDMPKRGED